MPSVARRACTSGIASVRRAASWMRSSTGTGVPAGAQRPIHSTSSKPGSAASATVGTSGSAAMRAAEETAKARSCRPCTRPMAEGAVAKLKCVSPDSTACAPWLPPR